MEVVAQLKKQLLNEAGPFSERPSRILFQDWLDTARYVRLMALIDVASNFLSLARARASGYEGELQNFADSVDVLPLELTQHEDPQQVYS